MDWIMILVSDPVFGSSSRQKVKVWREAEWSNNLISNYMELLHKLIMVPETFTHIYYVLGYRITPVSPITKSRIRTGHIL